MANAIASSLSSPRCSLWKKITRTCTESPTPTANKKEGRICVGMAMGCPRIGISAIVHTMERITVSSGSTTPTTWRKSSARKTAMTVIPMAVKRMMSRCITRIR